MCRKARTILIKHTVAISEDDTYSVKTWTPTTDIAVNWPGTPEAASWMVIARDAELSWRSAMA